MQTIDTRGWHARYAALESLASEEQDRAGADEPISAMVSAVDDAWGAIRTAFEARGYKASNDDGAEEVAAVLTRYLFRSNAGNAVADHVSLLIDARLL